jgi:Family of unknown function (DUF6152)
MKMALLRIVILAFFALSSTASAHHSFAGFDRNLTLKLKGTVKEFQFTNPHIWIQLLVTDAKTRKEVEWSLEGASPNGLKAVGWTRSSLKAGDVVTITINPLKDGSSGGAIVEVEKDGVVLKTKY